MRSYKTKPSKENELGKANGYCVHCGEFVISRWVFCPACGEKIEEMSKNSSKVELQMTEEERQSRVKNRLVIIIFSYKRPNGNVSKWDFRFHSSSPKSEISEFFMWYALEYFFLENDMYVTTEVYKA